MYCWKQAKNGKFELFANGISVMSSYAKAAHIDGRKVDTRFDKLVSINEANDQLELVYQAENGLVLTEKLTVEKTNIIELSEVK